MLFDLIHTTGNRRRWRTRSTLSVASSQWIAQQIAAIDGIDGVRVNARTGSVVMTYSTAGALHACCAFLTSLQQHSPALTTLLQGRDRRSCQLRGQIRSRMQHPLQRCPWGQKLVGWSVRAVDSMPLWQMLRRLFGAHIKAQDGAQLDFSPLLRWVAVRPVMPLLVNTANVLVGAVPVLARGVRELLRGRLNVEVLDATAIGISLLRRDFRTAGLVLVLLGLGDMLEKYTRKRSLYSLAGKLVMEVDRVWVVLGDGRMQEKPLTEVTCADRVVVRAGGVIAVDGLVVSGEAEVNQASMTGEALPVHRYAGGAVFAGTVVQEGELVIAPTALAQQTRLQKIVQFIDASEKTKAKIEGRAQRLADAVVPANFLLAALVWFYTRSWVRTAAVLLVDYSCALRLATPLAILTAMRVGIDGNVLVKGGRFLEALAQVDTVVFDKTGTLTRATPVLSDIVSLDPEWTQESILCLAACLEEHFPHPVSRCVVNAAAQRGLQHQVEEHDSEISYIVAHGICSRVDGRKTVLGSRHFVHDDEGVAIDAAHATLTELADQGKSVLYLAVAGRLVGLLAIVDPLREEAAGVIEQLRARGVRHVAMLTGDDERTAACVARALGLDSYRAQVLPQDKAQAVLELRRQGGTVLMVGDGMNDSPALSCADVGVTLEDGSAIAREVADVVLTGQSLQALVFAMDLGRATLRRIHSNFGVSVTLNSVFMAGGISGRLTPGWGAVAHNLTTIGVCLNAMRSPFDTVVSPQRWTRQVLEPLGLGSHDTFLFQEKRQ